MQPTKKKLFYTVYPFMHTDLHLSGIPKEVFGVIFGFWNKNERKEVMVSYSQINEMTGATDPSIASAIKRLKEYGFIDAETTEGKKSKYTVHLPESLISQFDEVYKGKNTQRMTRKALKIFKRYYLICLSGDHIKNLSGAD